jgi:6-phosphofructokinase 1
MHIALLTGGGDCPGLNAVIRAVTLALVGAGEGHRVTGIERGFLGLLARRSRPLDAASVGGIVAVGGTMLGTHNRCDPFHDLDAGGADRSAEALAYLKELRVDALVAIGGDGTMSIAQRFAERGLRVVGVPKTIDNDLVGTDRTFGFDSAVAVVAGALDRLSTTARSHGRVMIVETMGRYAGWIALEGGIAGGADVILIPELPFDVERVAERCRERERRGEPTLICIAEGAHAAGNALAVQRVVAGSPDPLRLGGIGQWLQQALEPRIASEVRTTLLGHLQRGGAPTASDRVLATRFGVHAAGLVEGGEFGRMVALQCDACTSLPLDAVAGRTRHVPTDHLLVRTARAIGVSFGDG